MQKIGSVHHLERIEEWAHDPVEFLLSRGAAELIEPFLKALPLLETHDHVGGGVCPEHARHSHDRGVFEARQSLSLIKEALKAPLERLLVALGARPDLQ